MTPYDMSDPITPNSDVSRTVKAQLNAHDLGSVLQAVALDNPSSPVRVLLTDDGASVWTHDNSKTIHVFCSLSQSHLEICYPPSSASRLSESPPTLQSQSPSLQKQVERLSITPPMKTTATLFPTIGFCP